MIEKGRFLRCSPPIARDLRLEVRGEAATLKLADPGRLELASLVLPVSGVVDWPDAPFNASNCLRRAKVQSNPRQKQNSNRNFSPKDSQTKI
jgi:hypothetical protein